MQIKTRKCTECKEEFYSNYDKSAICPTCFYKNKQKLLEKLKGGKKCKLQ